MQTKTATYETRINQCAIVKLFVTFFIEKGEVKIMRKSFMIFALDKNGSLDLDTFADDHFYAETPSQAAAMIKKFAKRYWPRDLENLEDRFNTQFFQKLLKNSVMNISYNERKSDFNTDVEKFTQEFKDLLKKYNFNLHAYDGDGASIYIQRERDDNNGIFESNNAFLSLEDGYVDL